MCLRCPLVAICNCCGTGAFFEQSVLHDIMTMCIIMHNMIVEDERDLQALIVDVIEAPALNIERIVDDNIRFEQFLV